MRNVNLFVVKIGESGDWARGSGVINQAPTPPPTTQTAPQSPFSPGGTGTRYIGGGGVA